MNELRDAVIDILMMDKVPLPLRCEYPHVHHAAELVGDATDLHATPRWRSRSHRVVQKHDGVGKRRRACPKPVPRKDASKLAGLFDTQ